MNNTMTTVHPVRDTHAVMRGQREPRQVGNPVDSTRVPRLFIVNRPVTVEIVNVIHQPSMVVVVRSNEPLSKHVHIHGPRLIVLPPSDAQFGVRVLHDTPVGDLSLLTVRSCE